MKLHNWVLVCGALPFFTFAVFGQTVPDSGMASNAKAPVELRKGMVVDAVKKNLEGDRAGLQPGDILLNWVRGDARGEVKSPFDLSQVEIEQAPRGAVTLQGLRGSEGRVWVLGQEKWGFDTRPNFPESLLAVYLEGQKLAAEGKLHEAAERWQMAARTANDAQLSLVASWFLFHAGEILADAGQQDEAGARYQEAIAQSAGSRPAVKTQILRAWAAKFQQKADWAKAEKYYQDAAEESEKLGASGLMFANILDDVGIAAWQRRDLATAEKSFSQAGEIQRRLAPGCLCLGKSLNGLGTLALIHGDLAKAEEFYSQALAIKETVSPGSFEVAASLSNLGVVAGMRGDLAKADEYYRQALNIQQKLAPGNSSVLAASLNNLGNVAFSRGDLVKAEEYYRQALAIQEKLAPESLDVAKALNNLGLVAESRGDFSKAEEYHRQALAIKEKLAPGSLDVAKSLGNLGTVTWDRGDLLKAEQYHHQALLLHQKLAAESLDIADDLNGLGRVAVSRGDLAQAEQYYLEAARLQEKLAPADRDFAVSLRELGNIARDRGDLAKAEEYYRHALAIAEKVAPESKEYAEMLAALAGIMLRQQKLDAAAPLFEKALNALEGQIRHLGGAEETRSGFRAQHASYYQDYIALLMRQKQPERALQVLERSRAQTLLEMLSEGHVDVHHGVDAALLEQERSLQADLSAKVDRRIQLRGKQHTEEQVAAVNNEIEFLLAQFNEVEGQIRTSSPSYAALTQPQSLSAKDIQQKLLDTGTVLLEYSLGQERSYVWVVTPESLASYELPKRAEIEGTARQVYEQLTARNRTIKGETKLQRKDRLAKAEAEYSETTAALGRMVLAPVAAQIKGKRLLIVSDGALQYIPFAVLPEPGALGPGKASSSKKLPSIVEHEIVSLPSASVLAVLRQQSIGRKEGTRAVAVLADPVFAKDDARVTTAVVARQPKGELEATPQAEEKSPAPWSTGRLTRSAADAGFERVYFPRLRFTRQEAAAIIEVTPAGQGMEALDFRASRSTATSPELSQYRVVHFATHGLLDSEHPELSGLVLSMVDERGTPQDGFLELKDIYNLNLPAELVVLSACETGLGKQIQGEGLVGLTRGFMYAGASRVLASLWKVDDVATAELMRRFYKAMEKDGMPPAAALRQAQIEMWKQKDWRSPYFWAAFQIQGEWK